MIMFKVAQLVILNDSRRARIIEKIGPRRYRVRVFGSGELLELPAGDLGVPGESAGLGVTGRPPTDAVGIDYGNASHRQAVAAHHREQRERARQQVDGD